jgi:hypothetical protein
MVFSVSIVQAEITLCTPINQSQIPYTITTSGIYCLTSDLISSAASGNVITINANNVVLDLNDHRVSGFGAGSGTQAIGIYANQEADVIVRNGTVRGFYYGVRLDDTSGTTSSEYIIENIRASKNTYYGIYAVGSWSQVRYNSVIQTGGSTVSGTVNAYGIYVQGASARVRDNAVVKTIAQTGGTSYALYLDSAASDSIVENNQLSNPALASGTSYGVYVNSSNVLALDNKIFNMTNGLFFKDATGIYKNNFAVQDTTPFTGGLAAPVSENNYNNP